MNSYNGARKLHRYLLKRWDQDIKDHQGDAPMVFGKERWANLGEGGTEGCGIVWEGFYDWTKESEIATMRELLEGSGVKIGTALPWLLEVYTESEVSK